MAATTCSLCGASLPTALPASSFSCDGTKVVVPSFSMRKASVSRCILLRAAAKENEKEVEDPETTSTRQSFTSITDALDFAQTRSEMDAELLNDARRATKSGDQMSREQSAALRRKIRGTYRDFFKDSVDVVGEYVEEGWVDKTCRYCKKDTAGAPRTKDSLGRYAHVACAENPPAGNFFTRLFGR